jgi:hypothetical protein
MTVRLAAAALLLCVPVAAHATEDPAPAAPSEAPAQAEKPKKICRMETRTGSVMPTRVCRTPEQVEADHQAARNGLDNAANGRGN